MDKVHLEYDPDFDSKPETKNKPNAPEAPEGASGAKSKPNIFDVLPPKTAFLAGAVLSLLALGTVGFLIMLGFYFKGGVASPRAVSATSPKTVTQAPTRPTPAPTPSDDSGVINIREVTKDDHIRGAKDAKITLVEFSDLECPFCKRIHPTMQRLLQEYDGKVRWVYRHFPLRSLHSKAAKEAEATECAAEQGKFWEYTDKIFEVTPSNDGLDLAQLPDLAEQLGLNSKKFKDCLSSGKYTSHVSQDEQDAVASGGRGTPHTVILTSDGKKIPVSGALPFEQFKSIIDPLL